MVLTNYLIGKKLKISFSFIELITPASVNLHKNWLPPPRFLGYSTNTITTNNNRNDIIIINIVIMTIIRQSLICDTNTSLILILNIIIFAYPIKNCFHFFQLNNYLIINSAISHKYNHGAKILYSFYFTFPFLKNKVLISSSLNLKSLILLPRN